MEAVVGAEVGVLDRTVDVGGPHVVTGLTAPCHHRVNIFDVPDLSQTPFVTKGRFKMGKSIFEKLQNSMNDNLFEFLNGPSEDDKCCWRQSDSSPVGETW